MAEPSSPPIGRDQRSAPRGRPPRPPTRRRRVAPAALLGHVGGSRELACRHETTRAARIGCMNRRLPSRSGVVAALTAIGWTIFSSSAGGATPTNVCAIAGVSKAVLSKTFGAPATPTFVPSDGTDYAWCDVATVRGVAPSCGCTRRARRRRFSASTKAAFRRRASSTSRAWGRARCSSIKLRRTARLRPPPSFSPEGSTTSRSLPKTSTRAHPPSFSLWLTGSIPGFTDGAALGRSPGAARAVSGEPGPQKQPRRQGFCRSPTHASDAGGWRDEKWGVDWPFAASELEETVRR